MTERDGDERLRSAFGAGAGEPVSQCPGSERIFEACHGLLSPGAAADVVDHMATCSACAESWRLAKLIREDTLPASELVTSEAQKTSGAWMGLAAAAAIIVAVGVWATTQIPKAPETQIVSAPATPAPSPTIAPRPSPAPETQIAKAPVMLSASRALVFRNKTTTDTFVEEFGRAIEPYRRDDYAAAIAALEPLARKYPDAIEPPFYIGLSHLLSGRREEARPYLARAAAGADNAISEQARKYLAIAEGRR